LALSREECQRFAEIVSRRCRRPWALGGASSYQSQGATGKTTAMAAAELRRAD
jgi:hypothetical protein